MLFMGNPHAIPPPGRPLFSATNQPKRRTKLEQLVELQNTLHDMATNPECSAKDCSALACAWERLENRRARMRMKPEPKPIDVQVKPGKQRLAILDVEPSESKAG